MDRRERHTKILVGKVPYRHTNGLLDQLLVGTTLAKKDLVFTFVTFNPAIVSKSLNMLLTFLIDDLLPFTKTNMSSATGRWVT